MQRYLPEFETCPNTSKERFAKKICGMRVLGGLREPRSGEAIRINCIKNERTTVMRSMKDLIRRFDDGGYGGGYNGGGQGNGQGGPGNGGNKKPPVNIITYILAAVLMLMMISMFVNSFGSNSSQKEVTYSQFITWVDADKVQSVDIASDRINITLKPGVEIGVLPDLSGSSSSVFSARGQQGYTSETVFYTAVIDDETLTLRLLAHGVEIKGNIPSSSGFILELLLTWILPILLMWGFLSLIFRRMSKSGGGLFNVGKSNAKVYGQKQTGVTFKDVAGEDEAKESLVEVVDFLHNPERYTQIGAKLPKGALLVGPPGTGKTLLAKAVAGEANVPFFSMTGSDFVELYVGVGASRVRDLFKEAEKNAPCIIFIDEIDAIGRSRDSKYGGGNDEREQTLNQLLSEMDGFDAKKGIIILAATNRPEILDKALLRPGRFDRRIIVDKPDLKGRVEILKVHAKDVLMDDSVDLNEIALATSGAVGSDLANMINEAAINAVKLGRRAVNQKDLFDAVEQVLVGKEKKDRIMSKQERKIVSYHETGHALIAALQKNSEPVQKITIVPRTMGALGYVMQVPEEEKFLNTKAELHDMLVGLLGGRAAEEIVFDTVTTGAANDIEKATNIARAMVTRYGMSKKFGLMGLETVESQYLEGRSSMNCADSTAADVDEEVMKILKDCYKEAKTLLKDNRELMDKLAGFLIEKETITGKEFMKIYRQEKGLPEPPEEEEKATGEKQDPGRKTSLAENYILKNDLSRRPVIPASENVPVKEGDKIPMRQDMYGLDPNWRPGGGNNMPGPQNGGNPYKGGVYQPGSTSPQGWNVPPQMPTGMFSGAPYQQPGQPMGQQIQQPQVQQPVQQSELPREEAQPVMQQEEQPKQQSAEDVPEQRPEETSAITETRPEVQAEEVSNESASEEKEEITSAALAYDDDEEDD